MLPSSPSADYISDATLRLCFGRAVFCCPFPGELGSTTAHLRRLPRKGRAGGTYKTLLKHRVQGAALPAMLPSPPSADYISDATLRLCFGRAVFCCPLFRRTGEHDCASPAVAPQGASQRRLQNFAQASRAKTKSMVLRLFCKLFVNPIDKVGGQEYIFSSRADRVLKIKTNCSVGGAQNHEEEHRYNSITALPPLGAELLAKNLSVR